MRFFNVVAALSLAIASHAQTVRTPPLPGPGTPPSLDTIGSIQIVKLDEPQYPALARQGRIQGTVRLSIRLIECEYDPSSVRIVSGNQMLAQAAARSAQNSKIECDPSARVHAAITTDLFYDFKLDNKCHDDKTTSRVMDNRVWVKACVAPPPAP